MKLRFTCILLSALLLCSGLAMAQVQPKGADVTAFQQQGGKLVYGGRENKLNVWIAMSRTNTPVTVLYANDSGAVVRGGPLPGTGAKTSPYTYIRSHDRWMQIGAVGLVIFLRVFFGFRRRSLAGMMLGGLLGGSRRRW